MKGNGAQSCGFCIGLTVVMSLGWILVGEAAGPRKEGLPTDWSHQHVVFSAPSTDAQAAAVMRDPRYWQQWNRQHITRTLRTRDVMPNVSFFASAGSSQADWAQKLGNGANAGAGVYPAKYSFQINSAACGNATQPDFAVFSTGLMGTSSQASIVAFDNLYSGCTGTVPQVYWAYNTGGQILTSPVLSTDGKELAFAQSSGGQGQLTILKWAASTTQGVGSPMTLVSNSSFPNCTAPCMITITLRNAQGVATDDKTSSAFAD